MSGWCTALLGLGLALVYGCEKQAEPLIAPDPLPVTALPAPSAAQPRLPTIKLWLAAEELQAEVATTWFQLQSGMMFRTNMAENAGMLFVFTTPHRASFWMKNTYVPLSAAYIDPDGVILEIRDLHPQDTNSVTASSDRIQYVLEVNQGWFKRHNVGTGTVLRTESGSLQETFFKRETR